MITTGVKELKNHLSAYLANVKAGHEVIVTERGKPIARIVAEASPQLGIRKALAPLIESGSVVLPNRPIAKDKLEPVDVPGTEIAEMVVEDRR